MQPSIKTSVSQIPRMPLSGRWASVEEFERELRESNLKFLEEFYNTELEEQVLETDD